MSKKRSLKEWLKKVEDIKRFRYKKKEYFDYIFNKFYPEMYSEFEKSKDTILDRCMDIYNRNNKRIKCQTILVDSLCSFISENLSL